MRWYCVHTSLPLQAELRVRAAPDSSAVERARICQGRAIAACSPVFQVPGDGVDDDPTSWLQVAYQDAASGETEGGFMMASLSDGTVLLTPWESTDFCGCCEVTNSAAQLYEGPHDAAQRFGSLQSANFLYCVMEESEKRVRIFHPELESAWIEKEDLQIVCTRFKHEECSTPHTFYELNEALPEEAQIAIRDFPSKEAQTVGLLSRGETLEVTVRGGNWLRIAGGNVDKAWIMWRTDALELLQEASDVHSGTCARIEKHICGIVGDGRLANQASCGDDQTETPSPDNDGAVGEKTGAAAFEAVDEVNTAPEVIGKPAASAIAVDQVLSMDEFPVLTVDVKNATYPDPDEGHENSALQPMEAVPDVTNDVSDNNTVLLAAAAATATDEDDVMAAADNVVEDVDPARDVRAWDEHSIQPSASKAEGADTGGVDPATHGYFEDRNVENGQVVHFGDDRPIRPAQPVRNEAEDVGCISTNVGETTASFNQAEDAEPEQTVSCWDDQPIRPALTIPDAEYPNSEFATDAGDGSYGEINEAGHSWDDRPIRPARTIPSGDDYNADAGTLAVGEDVKSTTGSCGHGAQLWWDDRPIRPTPILPDDNSDDCTIAAAVSVGSVVEDVVEDTKFVQDPWDGRPIRPAPTDPDEGAVNGFRSAADVAAATALSEDECGRENDIVQVGQPLDDRPIRPVLSSLREDATGESVSVHDHISDVATRSKAEGDTAEDEGPARIEETWDDRPICPTQSTLNQAGCNDGSDAGSVGRRDTSIGTFDATTETHTEAIRTALSWDDRPIQPASRVPDEGNDDDPDPTNVVDVNEENTVTAHASQSWGALPIQPAQTVLDGATGTGDDVSAFAVDDEAKDANSVHSNGSWDERPIRPARLVLDKTPAMTDVTTTVDDSVTDEPRTDEEAVRSRNDEPIQPATTISIASGDINNTDMNSGPSVAVEVVKTAYATSEVADTAVTHNSDSADVGSATIGDADEVPLVQTAPSHPTLPAPSMPNEGGSSGSLPGVNIDRTTLVSTYDNILTWPQHQATGGCPSALKERAVYSSGAGHPRTQDRQYQQPMTPLNAFERRYADSETTSGSENGEIALLGGLEDVFDPVDELLPAMQEILEELNGDSPGSVSETARGTPFSYDDAIFNEKGGACDSSGGFNGVCYLAHEMAGVGNAVQPDGISFLEQFGTVRYCQRKQSIYPVSDKLSLAMFNADQDDADLVFEVLVGDDPLSDDWFHDVSSRVIQAGSHSKSTPFVGNGDLLSIGPRYTYDLIMGNASPEDILEAELSCDDGDNFDLVLAFKYPVPKRRAPSPFRRVPSAPTGMTSLDTEAANAATKAASENGFEVDDSPSASRQPSPPIHRTSVDSRTSFQPVTKIANPPKGVLLRPSVGQPKIPAPTNSRLMPLKYIATPSSISKPPSSLMRPRSFVQSSHIAPPTTCSCASAKPALVELTSSTPATASPSRPPRSSLQQRGLLSTPSPSKTLGDSSSTRSSITGSIPKPTGVSGLQAPRGLRRPSSLLKK